MINRLQKFSTSETKQNKNSRFSLKDLHTQNSWLFKNLREDENYPIFMPGKLNNVTKNSQFYKRSQSYQDIVNRCRTKILANKAIFRKPMCIKTQQKQKQQKSYSSYKNNKEDLMNKVSFNKILTQACLMRNQRKKSKFLATRHGNVFRISNQKQQPKVKAQIKHILPRQSLYNQLCKRFKQKSTEASSKILFKIPKKKKPQIAMNFSNISHNYNEVQRKIQAWDFQQEPSFPNF